MNNILLLVDSRHFFELNYKMIYVYFTKYAIDKKEDS